MYFNTCILHVIKSAYNIFNFTTVPSRPNALRPSRLTSDSILLSWEQPESDVPQEINYIIESNKIGDSSWSTVKSNLTECSFVVGNLECDTVYKFRIIACSQAGMSEPSEECTVVIEAEGIICMH